MAYITPEPGSYEAKLAQLSKDFVASGGFGNRRAKDYEDFDDDDDNLLSGSAADRLAVQIDDPQRRLGMSIVVNGVSLSRNTAEQLRQLGMSLEWYTAGELEDIELACAVDGILVDDELGDNLHDKLHLDADEKEARRNPVLHGFHADEFEEGSKLMRRIKRKKELEECHMSECDKKQILAGMRMLLSPAEVEDCDHVISGLHSPHKKRDHVKCAA